MSGRLKSIKTVRDLTVYRLAFELAMEIFELTKGFPDEEKYSLTTQIRKSSRSVSANIREGFAKRQYPQVFIRHLNDALGSSDETREWLDYSLACKYIVSEDHDRLDSRYDEVNAMIYSLKGKWEHF